MLRRAFALLTVGLIAGLSIVSAQTVAEVKSAVENDQLEKADEMISKMIAVDSKNSQYYYWQGVVKYKMENLDAARTAFEQGIKARGKDPYNHAGLGMVQFQQTQPVEALERLQKALDVGKKDINVNFAVATAYLEEGSPASLKEAEVLLLQAQNKAPDNPESYIALGDYYFAKNTPDLALNQYNQAIEKDPQFVQGYSRVGQMLIEKAQYKEGAEMLTKAMEIDPDYSPAYKHMGELWLRAKDFGKARDNYKKYVELTGEDLLAKQRYASFLFLTEDYQGTIDVLKDLDIESNLKYRLLGMAHLELGDAAKAQEYMNLYFEKMEGKYTIASDFTTLAKAQLLTQGPDAADESIQKAIEMDPEQVEIYKTMADKAKEDEDYALEARMREKYIAAKEKANRNMSIRDYYYAGIAEFRAEMPEKADASFVKVLELKEDFTAAHFWRLRIAKSQDPDNEQWLVVPHAEKIIQYLGDTEMGDLKAAEKSQLKTCYMLMTFNKFDQQEDGTGNCEAAASFLEKALEFSPDDEFLNSLKAYCTTEN